MIEYDVNKPSLQIHSEVKVKFIYSSYSSEILEKYIKKHKWFSKN